MPPRQWQRRWKRRRLSGPAAALRSAARFGHVAELLFTFGLAFVTALVAVLVDLWLPPSGKKPGPTEST